MSKSALKPKVLKAMNKARFKRLADAPEAFSPFLGVHPDLEDLITRHVWTHERYMRWLTDEEWITRAGDEQYLFFWLLVAKAEKLL